MIATAKTLNKRTKTTQSLSVRLKPFPYQRIGTKKLIKLGGVALLADEMGLGKTLQVLMYLKIKRKEAAPACIVCPASLKYVWAREAKRLGLTFMLLESRSAPAGGYPRKLPDLIIVNYDILHKPIKRKVRKATKKKRSTGQASPSAHLLWLNRIGLSTVVMDEAHYLKNPKAIRTVCVRILCKDTPRRIAVTGTPITSRPRELFPIVNILWPRLFKDWMKFAVRYCNPTWTTFGWKYDGAAHMRELHLRLKNAGTIRRLKKDVLDQLPAKVRTVLPLPISRKAEYSKAHNDFLGWLAETHGARKAKKAARAEALTRVGYLKRLAGVCSLPEKIEWVRNFLADNPGEKLVVFAYHKTVISALMNAFPKISVCITGGTPQAKREGIVDKFQEDPKVRLFVGQQRAASEGITLTAAKHLAFLEIDWTPSSHTQAEDRIHRIGQIGVANIYYLVGAGTIEERLCEVLQTKQKVVSRLLDKGKGERLAIHDALTKSMTRHGRYSAL